MTTNDRCAIDLLSVLLVEDLLADFLHRENYTRQVRKLLRNKPVRVAVAFLGNDSIQLFTNSKGRLICNLESGATNPHAVRELMAAGNFDVRTHDRLHAKVLIGSKAIISGSANLSANGLGFEDFEARGWVEAGMQSSDPAMIEDAGKWFEKVWSEGTPVHQSKLEMAEAAWRERRAVARNIYPPQSTQNVISANDAEIRRELRDQCPDLAPIYSTIVDQLSGRGAKITPVWSSGGKLWVKFKLQKAIGRRSYAPFYLAVHRRNENVEVWFQHVNSCPSESVIRKKGLQPATHRKNSRGLYVSRVEQIDDEIVDWLYRTL